MGQGKGASFMLYGCYLRKGIVYVPPYAKVERGGYRAIDPVAVAPLADTTGLRQALHETIAMGNPIVPSLPRAEHPPPVVLKYARVNTYSAFVRNASFWIIEEKDGVYRIIKQRKRRDRGWEDDPDQVVTLPPGSTVDDMIERMIAILQDAASR
jgi:hypothetical protein